jgi:hypothetical protein
MSAYQSIQDHLDTAVPLKIIALWQNGGPQDSDFRSCAKLADMIQDMPVIVTGQERNAMARGIAILSFIPGGVEIFGRHWKADDFRFAA